MLDYSIGIFNRHALSLSCCRVLKLVSILLLVPTPRWKLWEPNCHHPTIRAGYATVPGRLILTFPVPFLF